VGQNLGNKDRSGDLLLHAGYTIVCKDIESEEKAGRQEEEDKEI